MTGRQCAGTFTSTSRSSAVSSACRFLLTTASPLDLKRAMIESRYLRVRGGVEGVVQQILSQEVPARGEEAKGLAELLEEVRKSSISVKLVFDLR